MSVGGDSSPLEPLFGSSTPSDIVEMKRQAEIHAYGYVGAPRTAAARLLHPSSMRKAEPSVTPRVATPPLSDLLQDTPRSPPVGLSVDIGVMSQRRRIQLTLPPHLFEDPDESDDSLLSATAPAGRLNRSVSDIIGKRGSRPWGALTPTAAAMASSRPSRLALSQSFSFDDDVPTFSQPPTPRRRRAARTPLSVLLQSPDLLRQSKPSSRDLVSGLLNDHSRIQGLLKFAKARSTSLENEKCRAEKDARTSRQLLRDTLLMLDDARDDNERLLQQCDVTRDRCADAVVEMKVARADADEARHALDGFRRSEEDRIRVRRGRAKDSVDTREKFAKLRDGVLGVREELSQLSHAGHLLRGSVIRLVSLANDGEFARRVQKDAKIDFERVVAESALEAQRSSPDGLKLRRFRRRIMELEEKKTSLHVKNDRLGIENSRLSSRLRVLQHKRVAARELVETLEEQEAVLAEKDHSHRLLMTHARDRESRLTNQLVQLRSDHLKLKERLARQESLIGAAGDKAQENLDLAREVLRWKDAAEQLRVLEQSHLESLEDREKELSSLRTILEEMEGNVRRLEGDLASKKREVEGLRTDRDAADALRLELAELRRVSEGHLKKATDELADRRSRFDSLNSDVEDLRSENGLLRGKIAAMEKECDSRLAASVGDEKLKSIQEELASSTAAWLLEREELVRAEAVARAAKSQLEEETMERVLALTAERDQLVAELSRERSLREVAEAHLAKDESLIAALESKSSLAAAEHSKLQAEHDELEASYVELQEVHHEHREKMSYMESALDLAKNENGKLIEEIQELDEEVSSYERMAVAWKRQSQDMRAAGRSLSQRLEWALIFVEKATGEPYPGEEKRLGDDGQPLGDSEGERKMKTESFPPHAEADGEEAQEK